MASLRSEKSSSEKLKRMISGTEDILFSCSNSDSGDNRELFVTENRVVIRANSKGGSYPIQSSTVNFQERGNEYRISISTGGTGYGIIVTKKDFEDFWKVYTSLLD